VARQDNIILPDPPRISSGKRCFELGQCPSAVTQAIFDQIAQFSERLLVSHRDEYGIIAEASFPKCDRFERRRSGTFLLSTGRLLSRKSGGMHRTPNAIARFQPGWVPMPRASVWSAPHPGGFLHIPKARSSASRWILDHPAIPSIVPAPWRDD